MTVRKKSALYIKILSVLSLLGLQNAMNDVCIQQRNGNTNEGDGIVDSASCNTLAAGLEGIMKLVRLIVRSSVTSLSLILLMVFVHMAFTKTFVVVILETSGHGEHTRMQTSSVRTVLRRACLDVSASQPDQPPRGVRLDISLQTSCSGRSWALASRASSAVCVRQQYHLTPCSS